MDLSVLYQALDIPEEAGPAELFYAARQQHYTLPYLVLSAIPEDSGLLSDAARGELGRAERRARYYEDALARVAATVEVRPQKGPLIARHYPDHLLRPQGDLDLLCRDEVDLWRAVRTLAEPEPLYLGVTVLGAPTRHLLVALTWPPEDPLLDPEVRVELSTVAFTGDFATVPIRSGMPANDDIAALLGLAEERLQRPFHARDAIDVLMLGRSEPPSRSELVAAIVAYRLAPEVVELLEYAAPRVSLGHLADLGPALRTEAERERERRTRATPPRPERAGPHTIRQALADGVSLHGMPLRRVTTGREGWDRARVHEYGDSALLLTPVGDYLLVDQELVKQDDYDAALRELARIGEVDA